VLLFKRETENGDVVKFFIYFFFNKKDI